MGRDSGIESGSPASSRANASARSPRIRSGRSAISRRHWRRSRITQREMSHIQDMQSTRAEPPEQRRARTIRPPDGSRDAAKAHGPTVRDFGGIPLGGAHAAAERLMTGATSPPRRSTARAASPPSRGAAPGRGGSVRSRGTPRHDRRRSPACTHPHPYQGLPAAGPGALKKFFFMIARSAKLTTPLPLRSASQTLP